MNTTEQLTANSKISNSIGCIDTILSLYHKEVEMIVKSDYPAQYRWSEAKEGILFFPFEIEYLKKVRTIVLAGNTLDAFFIGNIESETKYFIWWEGIIKTASIKDQISTIKYYRRKFSNAKLYLIIDDAFLYHCDKVIKENPEISIILLSYIKNKNNETL